MEQTDYRLLPFWNAKWSTTSILKQHGIDCINGGGWEKFRK